MKSREEILASRWLRPFAHRLAHPSLWHVNRRSASKALAIGLLSAFIIPIGQFACAALLAIPTRANVPIAAAATLVTNPLTFAPIYYAAYRLSSLFGFEAGATHPLQLIAGVTVAMACLGVLFAAIGFLAARVYFRWRLVRRWSSRPVNRSVKARRHAEA